MTQTDAHRTYTPVVIMASAALHRAAWEALLAQQPALTVAGTAVDPAALSPFETIEPPFAVLVDWGGLTPQLLVEIRRLLPRSGLLCLVDSYDLQEVVALLQAGATGCLERDAPVSDLARALIAVGRGEIALPPDLASRALGALVHGRPAPQPAAESLTEREGEVLALLARGLTNKDIAQTLILSVRTVEAHLHNIFGKLGVNSRTEAALWALQHDFSDDA